MCLNSRAIQFVLGLSFGVAIACSPTKFNPTTNVSDLCDGSVTSCIVEQGFVNLSQNFEIGAGKVDILFVNDNSASMSQIQLKLKDRFSGFIQHLDQKKIDYRIAVVTTELNSAKQNKLITLNNGNLFLTNKDSDRLNLFYSSIVRSETLSCETFIKSMFLTFGSNFQNQSEYSTLYNSKCPSPDTRGIYAANLVVSDSSNSFIRSDANLNIILISNDEVRQGRFNLSTSDSRYLNLEDNDKAESLISSIQQKFPNKYWDFNSIIVKDQSCQSLQALKTDQGQLITNQFSQQAISGGIGFEYAKISNSAARDIDNQLRPRGKILDICQNDYAQHFSDMATQITDDSRMLILKCVPNTTPIVKSNNGTVLSSTNYNWSADKITFKKGYEGTQVSVEYKCYTGPK